ncbi:MAG: hypothetical protein V2G48_07935 [bacterium JZ-2024 1]
MTRREKILVSVAVVCVALYGLSKLDLPRPPKRPELIRKMMNWPEEARKSEANSMLLWYSLIYFLDAEGRLPDSAEELMRSPYFPTEPEHLINPYTGKPVELVQEPSVGNIRWKKGREYSPRTGKMEDYAGFDIFYYHPNEKEKIIRELYAVVSTEHFSSVAHDQYQKDLLPLSSEIEKKIWWRCHILRSAVGSLEFYLGYVPRSYEIVKKFDWIFPWDSLTNVYTGQPMQDVSYSNPSPGDFTYSGFTHPKLGGEIHHFLPICYNDQKKVVFPSQSDRELIGWALRHKEETGESSFHIR